MANAKVFTEKYGAKLNFWMGGGGWGVQTKQLSVGVWKFSGTTQFYILQFYNFSLTV